MKSDIYQFNENYNGGDYHVVLDNETLFDVLTRNSYEWQRGRARYTIAGDVLTKEFLKPRKRIFNKENCDILRFKIVEVGTKRKTTHLPEGKLVQLQRI